MKQMPPCQVQDWLNDPSRPSPVLLDVREPSEFDICRIEGARLMPMASVLTHYLELDKGAPTVVICHRGGRSMQVALFLEKQGFTNVINLTGGVAAWAKDVAPAMASY